MLFLKSATQFSSLNKVLENWLKIESKIVFPLGLTVIIKAKKE